MYFLRLPFSFLFERLVYFCSIWFPFKGWVCRAKGMDGKRSGGLLGQGKTPVVMMRPPFSLFFFEEKGLQSKVFIIFR